MSALWPHLLRPGWLWLLPLLLWLSWLLWQRRQRIGRWQRLLPEPFHAVLLTGGRPHGHRLPWILLALAWLLALIILLGPSWQRQEQPGLKRADPLVVILELTPAMLAADLSPSRLEQAKRKLLDLLQARQEAQTAVVVFAGSAHTLVPLSDDLDTTRNLLDALKPSIMPAPGHRADLAVARGLELLEHGGLGAGRLLLIVTRLDENERSAIRERLDGQGRRLAILGVGTPQGAPIPEEDGSFRKDAQGAIMIPRLDASALSRFAGELGAGYRTLRPDEADLDALGLLDPAGGAQQDSQQRLATWHDQGHWLLLPLLLLAACAGRRGWLFCLPLVLLPVQPGHAFELEDLWLRPDQQGLRLLQAERPAEAATRFEDPQWQGLALYQAGDYEAAARRFAEGDTPVAHYNHGNALARSGALEAALEAYDQALELQPGLEPARHNRALVEELLRQQQAQPPGGSGDGDEDAGTQPPASPGAGQPADAASRGSAEPAPDEQTPPDAPPRAAEQPIAAPPPTADDRQPETRERQQAMEQWLRRIPDDPGELLRRKFLYEQRQRQEDLP